MISLNNVLESMEKVNSCKLKRPLSKKFKQSSIYKAALRDMNDLSPQSYKNNENMRQTFTKEQIASMREQALYRLFN